MSLPRAPLSRIVIAAGDDASGVETFRSAFPEITFDFATTDTLKSRIVDAEAVLMGWGATDDVFDRANKLVWVQNIGAGVERILAGDFRERGLLLTNGSGIMAPNMAEHVLAMMLALARRLPELFEAQKEQRWRTGVNMDTVSELSGQTAVLVGLGDIGLAVARRLKAFDVITIGVRRTSGGERPPSVDQLVSIEDLDVVLGRGDHVIISVPHTPDTVGMFDASRFSRFKDGARVYNVGRGTTVVQDALIAALESGKLSGAGLDVTTPEPLPKGDPLWTAPNVIITGHTSGGTPRFQERLFELFGENIRRYQSGQELLNVVDQERGY